MSKMTRRRFGGTAAAMAMAPAALTVASRSASADARLRLFWWGNPERNKRTFAVVDLYQKENAGTTVDAETIGWDDYWPKMATQAAGQNMADVVQMDYRYLFEYARRGRLEALDSYIGKGLDLSAFNDTFLDSGKVDGKLYAVPWTSNSTACYFSSTKLGELGIAAPTASWTWDDLKALCAEVKKAGKPGLVGLADKGHWEPMIEVFMRQRGKALYTEDGQLAYDLADIEDFFGYWDGMRQEGFLPPPDITVQDNSLQQMPLTLGNAVVDFAHSNQIVGLQALNKDELGMTMLPNLAGGKPGQYMKPSMLISIASTSKQKDESIKLTAFLASDQGAGKIMRVERGVPGDERVAKALLADAAPLEKMMIDYLATVSNNAGPLPPPPPLGAGEIDKMGKRIYEQLAFKRVSAKACAAEYFKNAQAILKRA